MKFLNFLREKQFVFFLIIPLHLSFFLLMPLHLKSISINNCLAVYLFWFIFGCLGIEIGYHRYFSHYSFKSSKVLSYFLAFVGIWGAQWSPIWWRSLHVLHHNKVDQKEDPHSPQKGFFYALITWYLFFSAKSIPLSSARDLMKSRFHNFLHRHYLIIFWLPILVLLLIDTKIALVVFIIPSLLAFWQENLINSICHIKFFPLNYRNFSSSDKSRNNLLLGYLIWGAGFHNNHHQNPKSYSFSRKWFEYDLCKQVVWLLLLIDKISSRGQVPSD